MNSRCTQWMGEHAGVVDNSVNYIDLLAYYEDTELSPEEIHALGRWYDFRTKSDREASRRLIELAEADKDGRVIVLPCKEGTPIYCDGEHFAPHCRGEIHEVKHWYYAGPVMRQDFRGEADYMFYPEDVGKTFFLSRDEAEKHILSGN